MKISKRCVKLEKIICKYKLRGCKDDCTFLFIGGYRFCCRYNELKAEENISHFIMATL